MNLDYSTLENLQSHPAWRLLRAEQAPLIVSFLHRTFVSVNMREISQSELVESLNDELFGLRERFGEQAYPKTALQYLNDWSSDDKPWLRKFYRHGTDEPYFDMMPSTEKAISWLSSLTERAFVGTESRLLTLFGLLSQITQGSETDPQMRINELKKKREEIDQEIVRLTSGEIAIMDDAALRDRFQQFSALARDLLSDFREVEHNFRSLDRRVRERIALHEGGKGRLLEEVMGERDAISDSDQGRSFRAFWDFLMSSQRQEDLTQMLDRAVNLPAIEPLKPDVRLRRVHYDWLEAGEHTQRTVAQLSQQLRRFLDDAAWLENRRIMDILQSLETSAITVRDRQPEGELMSISLPSAEIELPMERPLFTPPVKPHLTSINEEGDGSKVDTSALFTRNAVDIAALARYIRQSLQEQSQITLSALVARRPLEHGLSELLAYLQLATDTFQAVIDEEVAEVIQLDKDAERNENESADGIQSDPDSQFAPGTPDPAVLKWDACNARQVRLPRVIFVR